MTTDCWARQISLSNEGGPQPPKEGAEEAAEEGRRGPSSSGRPDNVPRDGAPAGRARQAARPHPRTETNQLTNDLFSALTATRVLLEPVSSFNVPLPQPPKSSPHPSSLARFVLFCVIVAPLGVCAIATVLGALLAALEDWSFSEGNDQ